MPAPAAVAALIVNWETRDDLAGCLRALREQAGATLTVVVVDNASTDGSAAMVRDEFPEVQLIAEEVNRGYTQGVNLGLSRCTGEFVLFLNADCVLAPGTVAGLAAFLAGTPDAGAVAPRLYGPDGEVQDFCYRFTTLAIAAACYTEVGRRLDQRLGGRAEAWRSYRELRSATEPMRVEHASAACLLVRRALTAGGLDPGMPLYFSDVDLTWRLARDGWHTYLQPRLRAEHRQGGSVGKLPWQLLRYELQRSLLRFYRLHRGPVRSAALTAILGADALARAAYLSARSANGRPAREELASWRRLLSGAPPPGAPWSEP